MKWLPLHLRRQLHLANYMYRVINGNCPTNFINKFTYISGGSRNSENCNLFISNSTPLGRFLFTKLLGLNPNLIELNELKTRVSFFLKLDNGKYCPWISLNFRNMTSSGDVIQIKITIFKNIIIQLVFQKCFLSLRSNTPCLFDA